MGWQKILKETVRSISWILSTFSYSLNTNAICDWQSLIFLTLPVSKQLPEECEQDIFYIVYSCLVPVDTSEKVDVNLSFRWNMRTSHWQYVHLTNFM